VPDLSAVEWPSPAIVVPDLLSNSNFQLRDVYRVCVFHRRAFLIFSFLGILAGSIAWVVTPTRYTASSLLAVLIGRESASPQDVSGVGPYSINIEGLKVLQSEITVVESTAVLEKALLTVGLENVFPNLAKPRLFGWSPAYPAAEQLSRAVLSVQRQLKVRDSQNSTNNGLFNGSNILRLTLDLPDSDIAARLLGTIVQEYIAQRSLFYASPGSGFLSQELNDIHAQLGSIEKEIETFRSQYRLLDVTQDVSLAATRLNELSKNQNDLKTRASAVEAEVLTLRGQLKLTSEQVFGSDEKSNQAPNDDLRNTLLKLRLERTHLAEQYSSDWPGLIEINRKIALVEQAIAADAKRPAGFIQRTVRNPTTDLLNNRLATLVAEQSALVAQEQEISTQVVQAELRADELRDASVVLHGLMRKRDVLENIQRQLALRETNVRVQDSVTALRNANIHIVQPPTVQFPGSSMGPSYFVGFSFAGVMFGICFSLGLASFRSVSLASKEAASRIELPLLAEFGSQPSVSLFAGKALSTRQDTQQILASLAGIVVDIARSSRTISRQLGQKLVTIKLDQSAGHIFMPTAAPERKLVTIALSGTPGEACLVLANALVQAINAVGHERALLLDLTSPDQSEAGKLLLEGKHTEYAESLEKDFDLVIVAAPGAARELIVRRAAAMALGTVLVMVAEQTEIADTRDLCKAIVSVGGTPKGFVFFASENSIHELDLREAA